VQPITRVNVQVEIRSSSTPIVLRAEVIFQEDYSGCWVTTVMPDGNAGQSGRVEPGDQLAAIDGRSSIGMKVDDICDAISEASSRSKQIELTFLRYVGPFQPLPSGSGPGHSIRFKQMDHGVDSDDTYPSQEEDTVVLEDDKSRSTVCVTKPFNSSPARKKPQQESAPSKRGSFRKKFQWLRGRGKKNASKAE
jgi:PDZ domain